MTFSLQTPELKFSDRLLNLFELLGVESRNNLAGKSAIGILLLKNEKEEKEAILKQEIRSRIHEINSLLDGTLLFLFISLIENNKGSVDSYAEIFKDSLRNGLKLLSEEDNEYQKSVEKVEAMVDSSEKNLLSPLLYSDIYKSKREILQLPKIKQLVDVIVNLHHIDLLHKNLKAVKDGIATDFVISIGSRTKKAIKEEFEAMDSDKGWNYAFKSNEDYERFCDLLTDFFEFKNPQIPKEIINLKPHKQTKVARALRNIYSELGDGVLKRNTGFLKIIKVLSPFQAMSTDEVYVKLGK